MIQYETIIHYVLDIISAPPGKLPSRANGLWDKLLDMAIPLRIYYPLSLWVLELWEDELPVTLCNSLHVKVSENIAKNAALSIHISKLSKLFRNAGMRCLFIKGAAVLARNIFPPGWRYLSDIDILFREDQVQDAFNLLKNEGYHEATDAIIQGHHHLQPLINRNFVGYVELHTNPYQIGKINGADITTIWSNTERLELLGEKVEVPSVTDHVWILMRTDPINRPLLPRLSDVIELDLFCRIEQVINFDLIYQRAIEDNMPNIVSGMSYACSTYCGMKPFAPMNLKRLKKWELWSFKLRSRSFYGKRFESSRNRFSAVSFLPHNGYLSKLHFFYWLLKYICNFNKYVPGKEKGVTYSKKIYRVIKVVGTFIITALEYIIICKQKNYRNTERINVQ